MAPINKGCLGLEYFCNEGENFWNKNDEQLKEIAVDDLNKLQILTNEKIIDAYVVRQKKAYPVYDQNYKEIVSKISNEIENNYQNLFLVGRNGMHKYNNQDHAMMSSLLTVDNIKSNKKIHDIWNINVDAQYHEEKKDSDYAAIKSIREVPRSIKN